MALNKVLNLVNLVSSIINGGSNRIIVKISERKILILWFKVDAQIVVFTITTIISIFHIFYAQHIITLAVWFE